MTNRRSKISFAFATTPDSDEAQYARKEMERLSLFLISLIDDLQNSVNALGTQDNSSTLLAISTINKQIENLTLTIANLPVIDVSAFLTPVDLQPIVVNKAFTGSVAIPSNKIAVLFDETENNGSITNNGTIQVV